MSGRKWKATRRVLRRTERNLDREKRRRARPPRWRRIVGRVFPRVVSRWWDRWEVAHADALRGAMKKTAHRLHPRGTR